jgi:hypothetical protein
LTVFRAWGPRSIIPLRSQALGDALGIQYRGSLARLPVTNFNASALVAGHNSYWPVAASAQVPNSRDLEASAGALARTFREML